ncbi:unnamed protein product [Pleuronectes platessa]|uniref:Uncharacterized protein n=1 Tax=Pleuronectes platessa TaxID=8262 RepID=A0A9N7Z8D9_PLEPL|nr:unnamed protein product [Pleuronectes platessa]
MLLLRQLKLQLLPLRGCAGELGLLQPGSPGKRRGRIPFQEQEKFALFGPALTSVATTRPSGAPLKRPGLHSPNSEDSLTACTPRNTTRDSLDFPQIRATRASNTAKVTIADLFLAV